MTWMLLRILSLLVQISKRLWYDPLTEAAAGALVIVSSLVAWIVLIVWLLGASGCADSAGRISAQTGVPTCGDQQAVDVWIEDAAGCESLGGAILFDDATVRVEATAPGCGTWTNVVQAAGARDAAVLFGALCPGQPLSRLRLLTLSVIPDAPVTLWPYVQVAARGDTTHCRAWSWPVQVPCEQ